MKKIVALLLALLSVLMCFASCSNTPDTTIPNTKQPNYVKPTSMEEKFIQSDLSVVYNGFYYYKGKVDINDFRSDSTIKVQNMKKLQPEGVQLYSDPLGNEDPFRQELPNLQMLVDEEASAENGGMPVLIIGIRYAKIDLEGDSRILLYKIVSYNTSSGKLTTLAEDVEELKDFYLYKNKLYCVGRTWDYTNPEEPDRIYNVLVMDKDGKNKKEYILEEKNILPRLIGVYNGKLYFAQNHNILSSDLDFSNSKIIIDDIKCNFLPVFAGGYMYYLSDSRKIEVDSSYTFEYCWDILRRPLTDILNKDTEETVLEGLYDFSRCQQNNLYICNIASEAQIVVSNGEPSYSNTCTHIFDINTGTLELLYDYRKENTANEFYNTNFVTDEIYVLRKGSKKVIVNRKTCEEIDATDIFG